MGVKLGVVMDPIESITVKKDTTLAMLLAAQKRGWVIHYMLQSDMYLDQGQCRATIQTLSVKDDEKDWFSLGSKTDIALSELDVVLMRKDPPFDMDYIYSTYLLEQAQHEGTLIVNDPQSLRDCNEKLFATQFPQCCPPLIVASSQEKLKAFHTQAQKFIPDIVNGDKRILMIDGEPVDYALARIPASGETRGNLAAGGSGVAQELTEKDRWICEQIGPVLREKGLIFVGLDVIGDYLTEINVTSPTCIREIDKAFNLDIAGDLMDCIQTKLNAA